MKLSTWILGAGVAVVAVAAWHLMGASQVQSQPAASGERIEALESRIAGLTRESRAAQNRVSRLASNVERAPIGAKPGTDDAEAAGEETTSDDGPPPIEIALEQSFEAETEVSDWTRGASGEAREALAELLPDGSSFGDFECRGDLCRVEINHVINDGHAAFIESLTGGPPRWLGPGSYTRVRDDDGAERTVAFLGRPGSDHEEGSVWRPEQEL